MAWLGSFLIVLMQILLAVLVFLLLLLALPFHYGGKVSWHEGQGKLEWYLTWGWFISLDKIMERKQKSEPEAHEASHKVSEVSMSKDKKQDKEHEKHVEGQPQQAAMHEDVTCERRREEISEKKTASNTDGITGDSTTKEKPAKKKANIELPRGETASMDAISGTSEKDEGSAQKGRNRSKDSDRENTTDNREATNEAAETAQSRSEETVPREEPEAALEKKAVHGRAVYAEVAGDARGESAKEQATARELAAEMWDLRMWILAWMARFWNLLHFTPIIIDGALGLGDPFQTNQFFRHIISVRPFLPRALTLRIQPNYVDPVLELEITLNGWLSPLQVLGVALVFAIDSTTRRLYMKYKSLMNSS